VSTRPEGISIFPTKSIAKPFGSISTTKSSTVDIIANASVKVLNFDVMAPVPDVPTEGSTKTGIWAPI
jgi:hypothetical protein